VPAWSIGVAWWSIVAVGDGEDPSGHRASARSGETTEADLHQEKEKGTAIGQADSGSPTHRMVFPSTWRVKDIGETVPSRKPANKSIGRRADPATSSTWPQFNSMGEALLLFLGMNVGGVLPGRFKPASLPGLEKASGSCRPRLESRRLRTRRCRSRRHAFKRRAETEATPSSSMPPIGDLQPTIAREVANGPHRSAKKGGTPGKGLQIAALPPGANFEKAKRRNRQAQLAEGK